MEEEEEEYGDGDEDGEDGGNEDGLSLVYGQNPINTWKAWWLRTLLTAQIHKTELSFLPRPQVLQAQQMQSCILTHQREGQRK